MSVSDLVESAFGGSSESGKTFGIRSDLLERFIKTIQRDLRAKIGFLIVALFGLAGYLVLFENGQGAQVWGLWGLLALLFSRAGNATPMDETPVDVLLTSGASCPDALLDEVVRKIISWFPDARPVEEAIAPFKEELEDE